MVYYANTVSRPGSPQMPRHSLQGARKGSRTRKKLLEQFKYGKHQSLIAEIIWTDLPAEVHIPALLLCCQEIRDRNQALALLSYTAFWKSRSGGEPWCLVPY